MRLWIDDIREAPPGYVWCKSVNEAKQLLRRANVGLENEICVIDIDHDAGEYAKDGGDYIKLLDWLEMIGENKIAFHIHSMNPVGVENMRRIIRKNGWKEIS